MFQRLLIPVDGSRSSASVIPYAAEMAARLGCEVDLLLVESKKGGRLPHPFHHHAERERSESGALVVGSWNGEEVRDAYEEYLDRHSEEFEAVGVPVKKHIRTGNPVDEILNAALALRCDIIAMATRHRGQHAGPEKKSVATEVLWRSRLPVILVAEG